MRVLRFPKAVQVAVCVDGLYLVSLADGEADLWSIAGLQELALVALLGLERYPLDVVLGLHGMLHCTYGDGDQIALHSIDWDMLLLRCIGGAGDDLSHLLAAAHDGDTSILDLGNDVSAVFADVEFLFHNDTSTFFFRTAD